LDGNPLGIHNKARKSIGKKPLRIQKRAGEPISRKYTKNSY
jgi:hypothetical protein